ncbi:glycoside hydrolase family 31 protein [Pseudacidobacterium ailaaui]|jgi:alpha-D-xyloside xylohydrolase|uniref:glycoside hydrolase family 31 protein n=1 Tax=Pseudacidobacterium ailaaui TaxID=1382359 RepID=UPI0006788F73|nr:TIM-barrel domain-containing protein [Pseudacidobacterium ailaaui]
MFAIESSDEFAVLTSETGHRLRIGFPGESIARITYVESQEFSDATSRIVTAEKKYFAPAISEDRGCYYLAVPALTLVVDKQTGSIRYQDARGRLLFREPERGGKWLTRKKIYRNVFKPNKEITYGLGIDGARAIVSPDETVFDREAFEAKLEFVFSKGEALFGLGSHEEGYGNLRGKSRELYQQNMKAVVPYFVSSRGYGVLFDCCSLMTFHDDALGSYLWADVVNELDFYVIEGKTFDEITRHYYELTGKPPMLPKWALGYVQSKERYVNARELVDVVSEYRRRRIPLDVIVLDWKSWPNGAGWGQKSFDTIRFPDPDAMTSELHAMGARLMVSIWPIMTGGCSNQMELLDRGLMLGNQSTYNAFLAEARECYWQQARNGLFDHGVDAWWCDCTEPFEADWAGAVKPEPHARLAINTQQAKRYLDEGEINAYSLMHSQCIYEGQRRATSAKRVVNLTRSSYAGQHRYGTITWSGDICGTWETLRRSISEGLNFCATGEPYWTLDIGGFFIDNKRELWFWRGDYSEGCRGITGMEAMEPDPADTGCRDRGYWELYTRWLQYAVFLPVFRSHGTDAAREIWRFGEEGTLFYDVIAEFIRLRYRMMPYLYSLMAQVTLSGSMMMRPLALDFPDDLKTHEITDQYLFGLSLLVCPVTTPMYYGRNSQPITDTSKTRPVYLPAGHRWFNFWTNAVYDGGQTILADAPIEKIPLYVRAGTVFPMTEVMQYTSEIPDAAYEIRIYCGADASFTIYEDDGDGYDYERGAFALVHLVWNETPGDLLISAREGQFPSLVKERDYRIVFISASDSSIKTVRYRGEEVCVSIA